MKTIILGADSETLQHGDPFTFQFFGERLALIRWINAKHATTEFLKVLHEIIEPHKKSNRGLTVVVYCHHLQFDMVSFFHDRWQALADRETQFDVGAWRVSIVAAGPCFARLSYRNRRARRTRGVGKGGSTDVTVWLIDTLAFFQTSLANLAELFCPDLPKLTPPAQLGKHRYTEKDKRFCAYALRDAEIAYHVGCAIDKLHREYDVQQSVSAPHISSRIFRHHFLNRMVPLPPRPVTYAALRSYHGGKNLITVPPGWYRRCTALDISSAYPDAMTDLPSLSDERLYRELKGSGAVRSVPRHGVYCISGSAKNCRWPILYSHDFKPIIGRFSNVWTTGYELNEGLRQGEIRVEKLRGYYYDAARDKHPSPFAAFARHFYRLKQTSSDGTRRAFYKIILNSLYGKFIQMRRQGSRAVNAFDADAQKIVTELIQMAGGLFHPFVATLITGHTRARVHRLEHRYKALHTATDGIITQAKPRVNGKISLGALTVEARGDVCLIRNKCYLFYARSRGSKPGAVRSRLYKRRFIVKWAKHGFHGTLADLERVVYTGNNRYTYIRANKVRESKRRGLRPNQFVKHTATLNMED